MSAPLTGKVAVFGITGSITLTGTGLLGPTEMLRQSASLSSSATPVDLEDDLGTPVSRAYTKRQRTVEITVNPFDPANPGNLATHKAKLKLPVEGSVVTLADFDSPDINGTWNFESGTINPTKSGYLQMTFRLSRVGISAGVPTSLAA
jgi:hypothetical protein